MTAAAGVARIVLAGGLAEIAHAAGPALLLAVACIAVLAAASRLLRRRTRTMPWPKECPCCTAAPYKISDCSCREDCGRHWCQAADPPACPWCDTHACLDRTMCNCEAACGSWLCEAGDKEASRG